MTKNNILSTVQAIAALLAAFGGALSHAAPPGTGYTSYAAPFSAVILMLLIGAISRYYGSRGARVTWIIISAVCAVGFIVTSRAYQHDLRELTIGLPPQKPTEQYIIGTRLTPDGVAIFSNALRISKTIDPAQVAYGVPGDDKIRRIWTEESIEWSGDILSAGYMGVMVLVTSSLFFAFEAGKSDTESKDSGKEKDSHTSNEEQKDSKAQGEGANGNSPPDPSIQEAKDGDSEGKGSNEHSPAVAPQTEVPLT